MEKIWFPSREMWFDNREEYLEQINILLKRSDLFELDRFLKMMTKHFFPESYG